MSSVRLYVLLMCALSSVATNLYTFPIKKHARAGLQKRQGTGAIGLGDQEDALYSVDVMIGLQSVPLLLATGTADIWSISTECTLCGAEFGTPQISASSLQPTNLDIRFDYSVSVTETSFASGNIVSGPVSVAGVQIMNQFLAAINNTNQSVVANGISGVLGLGFPLDSSIFGELIKNDTSLAKIDTNIADVFISSMPKQGSIISRLVNSGQLKQPMFTLTLQRESFRVGGNVGQLTLGGLPAGVSNDSLTWVPVRLYTAAQGGIPGPTDAPNEVYPLKWEIFIDDITLDGVMIPKPPINASIGYSAVIDTSASGIFGPQDIVTAAYSAYSMVAGQSTSGESTSGAPSFSCREQLNFVYTIGGNQFPIDPRDMASFSNPNGEECDASTLAPIPSTTSLATWILGTPFLKSNLVAFYFGNLTHPSMDPPRIGILSTVPSNAGDLYIEALNAAQAGDFLDFTSIAAPTGTFGAASTNSAGVKQASTSALEPMTTQPNGIPVGPFPSNDAPGMRPSFLLTISAIVASVWIW